MSHFISSIVDRIGGMPERPVECLRDCDGLCCSCSIYLQLSAREAAFLSNRGTKLSPVAPVSNPAHTLYRREGSCGNQVGGQCSIYDSPHLRPEVCKKFAPGSKPCLTLRAEHPSGIKNATPADTGFQNAYFGWEEPD